MKNPLELFNDWYQKELALSKVRIPSACCFSTLGEDGYPNSRFVSLKEIKNECFVITGPLNSRKGYEIDKTPKVSLTFWWTATEKQIRVQGDAYQLSDSEAIAYFSDRNYDSQIVSTIFNQGTEIKTLDELAQRFQAGKLNHQNKPIPKPKAWAGFYIKPKRIEFMEFKATRLHQRTLFSKNEENWQKNYLEP